jgi:hypothetical protein
VEVQLYSITRPRPCQQPAIFDFGVHVGVIFTGNGREFGNPQVLAG